MKVLLEVLLDKKMDETKNKAYFQEKGEKEKYPIFYKNKIRKSNNAKNYYYRSAIDNAFENALVNNFK